MAERREVTTKLPDSSNTFLSNPEAYDFFRRAHSYIINAGYKDEIEYVAGIKPLAEQTEETFIREYVWVVLNAGMKEQIARKTFEKYFETEDLSVIGHKGKRAAIADMLAHSEKIFSELKSAQDPLAYMETLPWIGPITKHHLARNLGVDTVKPDRHLIRLAKKFGYWSPESMCKDIQRQMPDPMRLGVIDVILWRYMNLAGDSIKD